MRKLIYLVLAINLVLSSMLGKSYCYAADSTLELEKSKPKLVKPKFELETEYLTHVHFNNRYIETPSLHILEETSKINNKSTYFGLTITRPHGHIIDDGGTKGSSASGIGPMTMVRYERNISGKLDGALDMSGGFIVYDRAFPAEGRAYDFMWRIGPRFIYKISKNSSVNIGYMLMHVSNGWKSHNPGYNARGISLGVATNF